MACLLWIVAAARASVTKRARASWLSAYSGSMNLIATRVPRLLCRPSQTEPMPPRPMRPEDLVLAGDQTCDGREGVTHTGELGSASAALTLDESPSGG